ncbi:MAG: hypothetical protein JW748_11755 [Anaerolineales bacterium]|nr:hypothetical protein [Anaerolineales bacterium]
MGRVTRSEWRWVLIFAAAASVLLALPYLAAFSAQGGEWRFSGFLFGVEDGNSYIADMRQGADGAWLFRIPYTTEPQNGALLYLPFLLLGKLAGGAAMHEQLVALFHLARIAAGIAMLMASYRFLAAFFESVPLRRWGLVAAAFGGGFGWILLAKGAYPLEFTSPEAFGFLSLLGLPHLAAARALLLLSLAWMISPDAGEKPGRSGVKIGLALALGWLFQPLMLVVGGAVIAAFLGLWFVRTRVRREPAPVSLRASLVRALVAAAFTVPLLLYSAASFSLDPVLRQWAAQNTLPAPPVWDYIISYSVLLLPALAGAWLTRRENERWLLPVAWMIIIPVLVYLPVSIQRRLSEGFWMALIVLALLLVERKTEDRIRRPAFILATGLLLPAAALFWGWACTTAVKPAAPAFLPQAGVRALLWLDANAEPGAVVLSGYDTGNALPAWTGLTAFIGHGPETLSNPEKLVLVDTIMDGKRSDDDRLGALAQSGAEYILAGPGEQARPGAGFPGCELVYREDGWEVWKVME